MIWSMLGRMAVGEVVKRRRWIVWASLAAALLMIAQIMLPLLLVMMMAGSSGVRGDCGLSNQTASFLGQAPVTGISSAGLDNAATIYHAATAAGLGDKAAIAGITAALQESSLGDNKASLTPNGDGDVGLFQQRGLLGWYADGSTVEENTTLLNNPGYAANTFFTGHTVAVSSPTGAGPVGYHIPGLVDIPGWDSLEVGAAVQKVQRSAFPSAYTKWVPTATALVSYLSEPGHLAVADALSTVACAPAAVAGDGSVASILAAGRGQIGIPYSWGGGSLTGPSEGFAQGRGIIGFDCSSLVRFAVYQGTGGRTVLPRVAADQEAATANFEVPFGDPALLQPGDLIFYGNSLAGIHHVAMATGNSMMLEAPHTGAFVREVPVRMSGVIAVTRVTWSTWSTG